MGRVEKMFDLEMPRSEN